MQYAFVILGRYTPIRSDGVIGEEKISGPSDIIFPGKLYVYEPIGYYFHVHLFYITESFGCRATQNRVPLFQRKSS
jgi:hypothetical protein